ncbi:nucleoside-diphosphate kinase [Halorarius halobius]|uniref:nucleoside-diphosphate kinase n=1 Tax=Halorarius halobius TaxID=2962671 RepID=UPI0020CC90E8|nr:nucleoside-diphosphate kinase [Halorarius halobius]
MTPSRGLVEEHYDEHRGSDVFEPLVDYIAESKIHAAVVSGENAASQLRDVAGDTEPVSADEDTIRGDFGDDSYEAAD